MIYFQGYLLKNVLKEIRMQNKKDKLEAAVKAARRIPMTIEEEYKNAGVPIPNDMLNASNTQKFVLKEKLIKWFKGIKK